MLPFSVQICMVLKLAAVCVLCGNTFKMFIKKKHPGLREGMPYILSLQV